MEVICKLIIETVGTYLSVIQIYETISCNQYDYQESAPFFYFTSVLLTPTQVLIEYAAEAVLIIF